MTRHDLRLDESLYQAIQVEAQENERSVNAEIVYRLRGSFNDTPPVSRLGRGKTGSAEEGSALGPPVKVGERIVKAEASPPKEVGAGSASDARRVDGASSSCPFDVPVGVKCKACGKVHRPKGASR